MTYPNQSLTQSRPPVSTVRTTLCPPTKAQRWRRRRRRAESSVWVAPLWASFFTPVGRVAQPTEWFSEHVRFE